MKDAILQLLYSHHKDLLSCNSKVKSIKAIYVNKVQDRATISAVCKTWFDQLQPQLAKLGIDEKLLNQFSVSFETLLSYTHKAIRKQSYSAVLDLLSRDYKNILIHAVEVGQFDYSTGLNISPYMEGLKDDEKEYLNEAKKCANDGCLRASIILGWCAAINRIHKKIESIGFDKFNKAIEEMRARDYGRFKRFTKSYKVDSMSELREVFDTDLLWVIEFLALIDTNQHERLRHCFLLRNNSAHPGEAPITGENLYSFYSDISKIILKNNKFDL